MKPPILPAFPRPARDEALSSWIERIGIFYGCEYDHWLGPLMARLGSPLSATMIDVDTDGRCRDLCIEWTGLSAALVPPTSRCSCDALLPLRARLAFCPECWDDDVAEGHQPYVRREWCRWSRVHCPRHHIFLTTRVPVLDPFPRVSSWLPLWRTRRSWATMFERSHEDGAYDDKLSYAPGRSELWTAQQWGRLSAQLNRIAGIDDTAEAYAQLTRRDQNAAKALTCANSADHRFLKQLVCDLVTTSGDPVALRMHENDLRERFNDSPGTPLLLGSRIGVLVTAAEALCMLERKPPIRADIAEAIGPKFRRATATV